MKLRLGYHCEQGEGARSNRGGEQPTALAKAGAKAPIWKPPIA